MEATNANSLRQWAMRAGVFLLLVSNGLMLLANHRLRIAVEDLRAQIDLPPGAKMPELHGMDFTSKQGINVSFGPNQPSTILLVYSPACPTCEDNWSKWDEVIRKRDPHRVRVVAMDLANLTHADFFSAHKMQALTVMTDIDPKTVLSYRLRLTPQTILLSPTGVVKGSWIGVLDEKAIAMLSQPVS
jgi:hypothetical protein